MPGYSQATRVNVAVPTRGRQGAGSTHPAEKPIQATVVKLTLIKDEVTHMTVCLVNGGVLCCEMLMLSLHCEFMYQIWRRHRQPASHQLQE